MLRRRLAGARATMDAAYKNNAASMLVKSMRDIKFGAAGQKTWGAFKAPLQVAMAGFEASAWPIMTYQVPRLKLGVFYHMAQHIYEQADHYDWNDVRIETEMAKAWDSVDNRMGQLIYDNLHWNRVFRDCIMLAFRAPGWTLGSIREFGGGLVDTLALPYRLLKGDPIVTRKMGYALGAGISYAIQGAAIQYLLTGEPPEEIKDLYFPKTGRKNSDGSSERLSMPHYSKDIIAWYTNPAKTTKHKLNPLWGTMADLYENEDYFGNQIREGTFAEQTAQAATHFAENMFMPFSFRNYAKYVDNGETKVKSFGIAASGVSPAPAYITRTRAMTLAISHMRTAGGQKSHEKAEYYDKRRKIIKDMRLKKKIDPARLEGFTELQRKSLERDSKLTSFQAIFKRLSFKESIDVFNIGSRKERKDAWNILLEKRVRQEKLEPEVEQMFYNLKLN